MRAEECKRMVCVYVCVCSSVCGGVDVCVRLIVYIHIYTNEVCNCAFLWLAISYKSPGEPMPQWACGCCVSYLGMLSLGVRQIGLFEIGV